MPTKNHVLTICAAIFHSGIEANALASCLRSTSPKTDITNT